jgi:hypothetical protein
LRRFWTGLLLETFLYASVLVKHSNFSRISSKISPKMLCSSRSSEVPKYCMINGTGGRGFHPILSRNGRIIVSHRSHTQLLSWGGYAHLNQCATLSPLCVCSSSVFSRSLRVLEYALEDFGGMHSNEPYRSGANRKKYISDKVWISLVKRNAHTKHWLLLVARGKLSALSVCCWWLITRVWEWNRDEVPYQYTWVDNLMTRDHLPWAKE